MNNNQKTKNDTNQASYKKTIKNINEKRKKKKKDKCKKKKKEKQPVYHGHPIRY